MDTVRKVTLGLFAIVITVFAAVGCQSTPAGISVRYDNVRFMDVWNTYSHCLSTEEFQSAVLDSTKLQEVSQIQASSSGPENFLPAQFKNLIDQSSSRQAVDVHAMAASCSLHAGTLAFSAGEHDLARNQFSQILNSPTQSGYSYYAAQARARLAHLELTLQAFLP